MRDALDEQIEAFQALLPEIRAKHGTVWALVANGALVKTFAAFATAARYANEHFAMQPVLIRHTEENLVETAPFVHVSAEG